MIYEYKRNERKGDQFVELEEEEEKREGERERGGKKESEPREQ